MWYTPISISGSTTKHSLLKLVTFSIPYQQNQQPMAGLLLLGPVTPMGLQCIREALEMTSKLRPQLCIVPLQVEMLARYGPETDTGEEVLPF